MPTDVALFGCPYSLPDDKDTDAEIARIASAEDRLRDRVEQAAAKLVRSGAFVGVYHDQRAREVYESNSIEGLGPSLPETARILETSEAGAVSKAATVLQDNAFFDAIRSDRHLVEVLGLHGAKILGETLLDDMKSGRPLTEADLREMHQMITLGESFAGRYKHWHVKIGGENAHEPHLPTDTPQAMHELVTWLAHVNPLPGSIKAAAAHAWLTHIHPFEDGNGRLARLLANLILARHGLPPAIITHNAQRIAYLDALAHSDTGGDIMPLTGIFLDSMKRFGREIQKPSFLRKIIKAEIAKEHSDVFSRWTSAFDTFTARLFGELQLRRFRILNLDQLDAQSFGLLSNRDTSGSTWLFKIVRNDLEVLVWAGYSSDQINSHIDSLVRYPSLFFSVRAENFRARPYRKAHPSEVDGLEEVCVTPGSGRKVYAISDGRSKFGTVNDSAHDIATRIENGLRVRLSR